MLVDREDRYMGSGLSGMFPTVYLLLCLTANTDISIGYKRTALPAGILWLHCG